MARPCLLDVNVLIALFDSAHVHHLAVHAWFASNQQRGWRTCPLTENGFLRILSHPSYPNVPLTMSDLAVRLEALKRQSSNYAFCPDDFSFSDWLSRSGRSIPSSKLTDAYLLRLAVNRKEALATLDLRIEPEMIGGCDREALEYIPT
jgi:toxin-antitoxin system PIN domain toxin